MQSKQVSLFYVVLIYMMVTGLLNHVTILPPLLQVAGRDAWMSAVLTFLAYCVWVSVIWYIARTSMQQNLLEWLEESFGKTVASIIAVLVVAYLFLSASYTLKDMVLWTKVTYLPYTPQAVTVIVFCLACAYLASKSLRTIAAANAILLPIVIVLGFFVMSSNFQNKDYSQLMPMLEHGWKPVLKGMTFVSSGFVEVLSILFVQHRLKTRITYTSLVIIGLLLLWLTLGPTMGAIATFGHTKSGQLRFPAYEQWALVTLGRFFEHLDFLSIYQWLSGAFIRISVCLFMIIDLMNFSKKRNKRLMLTVIVVFLAATQLAPIDDHQFISMLSRWILPFNLIFVVSLSVVLLALAWLDNRRDKHSRAAGRKRKPA